MARIGKLAQASLTVSTFQTVYTVPAGLSHAVVHIIASPTSNQGFVDVYLNSVGLFYTTSTVYAGAATLNASTSISCMLSPGDSIEARSTTTGGSCVVTGYEVA